ncbi:MAG: 3-dehydroquinate synthase [Acidobacteriota bacterium]
MTTAIGQERIDVKLAGRSYPILIEAGLRHRLGSIVPTILSRHCQQTVIVSNARVFTHYGSAVCDSLKAAGLQVKHILIGDGERFKTLSTAEKVYSFLIQERVERNDCIIALGGGVVGDLAGFVAATYLRGIDFLQLPTTLLGQIDAAIGGKTAVNHPLGKNLIGAFHQPKLVAIDPETLVTLPKRELRAALAEAIKYGVIADAALFALIEQQRAAILAGDMQVLRDMLWRCCAIKAGVVSRDERESGERRILNFGHTIGHALEAVTHYRRFKHGEAVAYGIIGATKIALALNLIEANPAARIEELVYAYGPLPAIADLDPDCILQAMNQDKKVIAGQLVFVLPERIGHVIIREAVPIMVVRQALSATLKREEDYEQA